MIKILTIIFLLCSCSSATPHKQTELIEKVVIKRVEFSIMTVISVKCEEFETQFESEYLTSTLTNKEEITKLLENFDESTPLDSTFNDYIVDTRSKIEIHYKNGDVNVICLGNPAYYKNGKFYKNTESIRKYINSIDHN